MIYYLVTGAWSVRTYQALSVRSWSTGHGYGVNPTSLQWRHNGRDGVSNHRRLDCLLNRLFRRQSKKTWKLHVTGLCERNPPVIGGFPSQRATNTENVSIWWRYHVYLFGREVFCEMKLLTHVPIAYIWYRSPHMSGTVSNTASWSIFHQLIVYTSNISRPRITGSLWWRCQ